VRYDEIKNTAGRFGVANACRSLGISRKWYAARMKRKPGGFDPVLVQRIHKIAKKPRYGYRRVTVELQEIFNFDVNHKTVLKIMRKEGLGVKKRVFRPRTTNSKHDFRKYPNLVKDLVVERLNQVWVADITYVLVDGKFGYLATILDRYSRKCLGWNLSRTLEAEGALQALDMAFDARKGVDLTGLIHHSDQGVQYACDEYQARLRGRDILTSMTEDGDPRENAFAESFNKTVKYEEVYLGEYESFEEAERCIAAYIEYYNRNRLHSSIGYAYPEAFEADLTGGCGLTE